MTYNMPKQPSKTEIIVNRSRFIGRCFPVSTEEEARAMLDDIRRQHWDAAHNCYAYSIFKGASRFSDDGEPSGTAGLPIMEAIKQKHIANALVVVTRYFGGILLGAGGLARAYLKSASKAIEASGINEMRLCSLMCVAIGYDLLPRLEKALYECSYGIMKKEYGENVTLYALCESGSEPAFSKHCQNIAMGRIQISKITEDYYPLLNT